jgi:pyrrolidone-carboxylate peptidase
LLLCQHYRSSQTSSSAVFFSFVILLYNIFRVVAAAGHECLSGFIHLFIIASASVFYLHIGSLAHV